MEDERFVPGPIHPQMIILAPTNVNLEMLRAGCKTFASP